MTKQEKTKLETTLWNIADTLRGAMNADDFRDYMLMEQGKYGNAAPTVQPSEHMLPYNHTDMRPIGRTLLIKMRHFNIFRSIRLILKGAYLKYRCRKLQAKRHKANKNV